MSEFDHIRPYNDAEVPAVLARLLADTEFLDSIAQLKLPKLLHKAAILVRPFVRSRLKQELSGVATVRDLQGKIERYLGRVVDTTIDNLTTSGLDKLDKSKSYLFISNHRDISMDPAMVNWVLYKNGFSTLRIAIGDNLLTKPFASDLMRLNKSFIVNRSLTAPRERLKSAKLLSKYIRHSIQNDQENIWLAQREGRAKDGIDKTNSAIINMLFLSRDRDCEFGEHMKNLNIVPVAISYEYDPCDQDKARELHEKSVTGEYIKDKHEDVKSIARGITGYKGNVHLSFGDPIGSEFNSAEAVAENIDLQVLRDYVLHPSNCFAYEKLEKRSPKVNVDAQGEAFVGDDRDQKKAVFDQRIESCPTEYRDVMLKSYANPVYALLGELPAGDL